MSDKSEILKREEDFHDEWAGTIDPQEVKVDESFTGSTSPEGAWIIEQLGDLKGKKVLELGSGAGEGAVFMAKQGADVTATDLSSGMLEVVKKVAALHGVSVKTAVASADDLSQFGNESFDVVYAANLLHHVDIARCLDAVKAVLKPGGTAAFWDPVAHNPAINVYRRMAMDVRTPDEHPIRRADMKLFRERFSGLNYKFFWLASLLVFVRFWLVDRIHPSADRYWKLIITRERELRPMVSKLMWLDKMILKVVPFLGWWCWNIAIIVRK
ncbi:MAG: class I SAM-dependent methyltransferase [Gammaproteobacteria bacterium]|nr:class I SAM-dependent methyltransferase [Gammaproteobacteria bacterium]MDH5653137.1 class I SAM-dependent methyltransferase [Gammaproteobacteria bacterium]